MSRAPKKPDRPERGTIRCAIYTRKSTEEGLEQEFNSLDAQRESAEAYIASQRAEGWTVLPDRYDDGGYSGGSMERPALERLLRDIEAGKIDCVVVYKVDRLSRSLMDFARIMETFERHGVSFVSVTQHFNTTHSMGRLTLNILLSFAQFEREIIGERICELDAAFFHLYLPSTPDGQWKPARRAEGAVVDETPEQLAELKKYFPTPRDAVAYIMETFPIVKRKDIEKYGSYRTKETILGIYDEMQRVMAENAAAVAAGRQPNARYQTRLNPPPGPPCDAAGNFIPMAQWDRAHWPPHIHPPREQGAVARPIVGAPAVVVPVEQMDEDRLLAAFREVRQGMSADYVVADPKANARFQEAARSLGLRAEPMRLNQALLNARKAGKLKDEPSERQYRLATAYEPYVFASEWSVRHLQRTLLNEINRMPTLDELLCNPTWAQRFDEIVARIKPGFEPIDYRWAALAMRKKGRSKPREKAIEMPMQRQLTLGGLFGSELPADPGLYLIRCGDRPLYLDWAENLVNQVERHREVAGQELVPPWLLEGVGRADQLRYTVLRGLRERELQEMRITHVARLKPWLNLLDFGDAA